MEDENDLQKKIERSEKLVYRKDKILDFCRRSKRMPTYEEMKTMFGFNSKNAVFRVVNEFIELGILRRDSSGHITPNKMFGEVPLLGLVEAGIPSVAEGDLLDTMSIDDYLIKHTESTYILQVKGDSMIDEGIKEGDLVIVERRGAPKEGDIVIAEVDGGWTMKYFKKDKNNRIYLQPANKNYEPIYPEYDLKIAAIVTGVIRKY